MYYLYTDNYYRDDLDDREVIVSIRCITYNHEKYIAEALEGFVMQKTNFRFEAIVHDDASTDGTAAIIREYAEKYPSIIKPIFETENQYSKKDGSLRQIVNTHLRGIYVAYCEGDDYWTDPLKLQKQVDFLESHPDYSLVAHNCIEIWEDGSIPPQPYRQLQTGDVSGLTVFKYYPFQTATILIRKEVLQTEQYQRLNNYNILARDAWLMMCCSVFGKLFCFEDCMSVYRRHASGMSFVNIKNRIDNILQFRFFGMEFGPEIKEITNKIIADFFIYEILVGLRTFNIKRITTACKSLNRYCDTDWIYNFRICYRQLLYFKPFKYFLSHKKSMNKIITVR